MKFVTSFISTIDFSVKSYLADIFFIFIRVGRVEKETLII